MFVQDICLISCYYYTDGCHRLLSWSYNVQKYVNFEANILHRNQKCFLLSPVYKHLKGLFKYGAPDWRKPLRCKQFIFKRNLLNKKICYITDEEKTVKNEWENDGSEVLWALYSVYKKLGQFFSILTC